jgi:hypothetical protein
MSKQTVYPNADVVTADEHAHAVTLFMRHAFAIAVVVTACSYAIWLLFSLGLSGWIGLGVFPLALGVAYIVVQRLMWRSLNEEVQRRRDLLEIAKKYRTQ